MQQRDNELERLVHDLEMKVLNQESVRAEQEAQDSRWAHASHECRCPKCRRRASRSRLRRFKMLESELELSLKKSLRIKEDKMAALEAHLQESSRLNQHLRQELSTVSPRIHRSAIQAAAFLVVTPASGLRAGEDELRGSASEAGGAGDIVSSRFPRRHRQGDDRMAARKPRGHQGAAEAQRPPHPSGEKRRCSVGSRLNRPFCE